MDLDTYRSKDPAESAVVSDMDRHTGLAREVFFHMGHALFCIMI